MVYRFQIFLHRKQYFHKIMIRNIILVGIGGSAGSVLRYLISQFFKTNHYPISTFIINIIGSFIIGVAMALSLKYAGFNDNWKALIATGFCGGFTTFSAFSYENVTMLQQGKFTLSLFYIFSSIILGLLATITGLKLAS